MGYAHIDNLYKNQEILMFKECYALEKIHGTSCHITHKEGKLTFFAGGASHQNFVNLFDQANLLEKLKGIDITIYGEGYGGKQQGMSNTYGKDFKFVAFDVLIDNCWLSVPQAEVIVKEVGLEFVHYERIPTDIEAIDKQRDMHSIQAIRNGMGEGKLREGVVLRPLIELRKNNDERIMSKHKGEAFAETSSPRQVMSPEKLQVLDDASKVANEWVTPMRLEHVLDKIPDWDITKMPQIIVAMVEDVKREGEGEIVWSAAVEKAVGKATAAAVKRKLQNSLQAN